MLCAGLLVLNLAVRSFFTPGLPPGTSIAEVAGGLGPEGDSLRRILQQHQLTVLAFFETWCVPCRVELPELEKLAAAHPGADLAVVGIYGPSSASNVEAFAARLGLHFTLWQDAGGQLARALGIDGVPTAVVVDAKSEVVQTVRGLDPDLSTKISALLAARAEPS
jgi:thiol-disulfide isomerase/thioredoxin